jgi:5-methyltetrahydrofolate corrinoid/iron sulfur protein methyltransferase
MLIVGELINASRKAIAAAIEARDQKEIQQVAKNQIEAGANYIDVNAGVFVGKEPEYLQWLVKTVQSAVSAPCCIDSPDPKAIQAALAVHTGTAMINSISLEKDRLDSLLPIVAGTDLKVVALCMSDEGMPTTVDDRMAIADKLVNRLLQNNVAIHNIYVDPLVQPVSTNIQFGVHTLCGLSNVSFGLPNRKLLNQTFMSMAIAKGLDGAIINPLDKKMMTSIITAEALAGKDAYCMQYLKAYRAKAFEF